VNRKICKLTKFSWQTQTRKWGEHSYTALCYLLTSQQRS